MPPIDDDDDLTPDEREFLRGSAPAQAPAPAAAAPAPDDVTAAAPAPDPSEDDDTAAAPAPAAAAPADAPAPAPAPDENGNGESDGEGNTPDLQAQAEATEAPQRPTYDAPQPRDFAAERKALRDQQIELDKQWSVGGDVTDEERNTKFYELQDKIDAINAAEAEVRTIDRLNRQAVQQQQETVLNGIAAASSKAGELDYSKEDVAGAFDAMLKAVAADPSNKGKSFAEVAQATHNALCAARGIQRGSPAPSPAPTPAAPSAAPAAPAAPAPRNVPPTLARMPVAGAVPTGNDAMTTLAAMDDPDEAEAQFERMAPAQREALRRSTISSAQR